MSLPENSRHVFDDRKLKELAQSIQAHGIKVRLIVRQGEEGKFEIVAGARRYRAARLGGQVEVPCEVRDYTDAEARDARLIENLQRADLTPLEEAESYQQRLAAMEDGKPLTAAELAQQIGKNAFPPTTGLSGAVGHRLAQDGAIRRNAANRRGRVTERI